MRKSFLSLLIGAFILNAELHAQPSELTVIAYYSGNKAGVANIDAKKLTHIIFSFCHLKGDKLTVDNAGDSATIKELVELKSRNPALKVMLSLGGWGGCKSCSDVFDKAEGRVNFAASVKELADYFKTDGLDLDWEYPTIPGHPGHPFKAADKKNFTSLVKALREKLGRQQEISFAAGGFSTFLEQSVEWDQLASLVDRVNLMSYDLVNGFSTVTGHHTPLYSTGEQKESADQAVRYLQGTGIPLNKIVIGAAFYARTWENVENKNNGLYQSGKFKSFVPFNRFLSTITEEKGYQFYRDEKAGAPYAYNPDLKMYATFDDKESIRAKTRYAIDNKLNGIMFWELTLDKAGDGLLDVIHATKHGDKPN